VVPLRVIDELDSQKYGQGQLAERAATAIRYLERALEGSHPGEPVELRQGVVLEVWVDGDDRGSDADLSILRCAADLNSLHPATGARVLTDDFGMRLRAQQMGLKSVRLPADHRKPSPARKDEVQE
jgi:predicted ribonuclease YlaK